MSSNEIQSFRDLLVWRRAFQLCVGVYRLTDAMPREERFGLTQELRKTARSVVYNIAEGHRRGRTVEFMRFLDISRGSAAELMTQLLICSEVGYLNDDLLSATLAELETVERMLAGLKRALSARARR